jgi:hypothetical protein
VARQGADNGHLLQTFLNDPYGDQDPLVRVALDDSGRRLLVAAHHGVVDGMGLLAVVGRLANSDVSSQSRGIGRTPAAGGFAGSAARRLYEALMHPPNRLAREPDEPTGSTARSEAGDVVAAHDLPPVRASTSLVTHAAVRTVAGWNTARDSRADRIVVAVGASRRSGTELAPDRDTAYLRVVVPRHASPSEVAAGLAATAPEPDFPERSGGTLGRLAIRVLRRRLGSTLLVSNLGLVGPTPPFERVAFYPVAAGPDALAVGVASTAATTTVTVRLHGSGFSRHTAEALCATLAATIAGAEGKPRADGQ